MKKTTWKQRILGCLSFSLITHLGLVAAAFVLPGLASEGTQKASAPTVSTTTIVTASDAAPLRSEAPVEVVQAPAAEEVKPQLVAANDPLPVKDTNVVAPVFTPKKHSTQISTSLPEKHSKLIKDTADDADENLKKALTQSRQETSRPELASDIVVPVVAQNDLPEQLQPDATFPEESSPSVAQAPAAVRQATAVQPATAPATASAATSAQPQVRQAEAIAPIQRQGQIGSSAPSQGAIRNGDDLKEMPGNIKPVYPTADRRAGRQGTVVFIASLSPDGQVMNIRLEKSSSSASLDSAAYAAFRSYRYQGGQEGSIRKAFTFTLKGEAVEAPVARR